MLLAVYDSIFEHGRRGCEQSLSISYQFICSGHWAMHQSNIHHNHINLKPQITTASNIEEKNHALCCVRKTLMCWRGEAYDSEPEYGRRNKHMLEDIQKNYLWTHRCRTPCITQSGKRKLTNLRLSNSFEYKSRQPGASKHSVNKN